MRLEVITATSVSKGINKARYVGNLSLHAVARLNMLNYFLGQLKDDTDKRDEYLILLRRINNMTDTNRKEICNIREASCATGVYQSDEEVINPYNPQEPPAVIAEPEPANLPPSPGDNTITVDPGVTTVLTISMFTVDTMPAYSDPEGDLLDAIRVDRLHNTNVGIFYINGTPVTDGMIITRAQLLAEELTHIGIDTETILLDGFEFSVRDTGSMTWAN